MSPTMADDDRSEELRLALVLNGGVSLAVWMGGVAYELNRLVRETHPVYAGLLRLTRTKARIDVISGTSAGGVNGAALALAQVHDTSLYGLREVWLSSGGLDQLMREPEEKNPPSLLKGDAYFLPQIEQALAAIATGEPLSKDGAPMLLSLTTTLLRGIGKTHLDDFGAVIEDTVHRAHFQFERREGSADDAFAAGGSIVKQLARAARASASFPVAFEPALYDSATPPFEGATALVEQGGQASAVKGEAYLLDGGILDNRPFDAALEAIGKLPADGNTRRVLAYVAPDPAAAVAPPPPGKDGKPPVPTLAEVALQSTIGIPSTQSIADQLAEVREHGNVMRKRWQRITGLLQHTPRDELLRTAEALFPAYRARRLDGVIDYLLDELVRGLAMPVEDRKPAPALAAPPARAAAPAEAQRNERLRRSTRLWLRGLWLGTGDDTALWGDAIPTRFVPCQRAPVVGPPEAALAGEPGVDWRWGLYTLEFVAGVVIDVLRRTQRLEDLIGRWQEKTAAAGRDAVADGPPMPEAMTPGLASSQSWELVDRGPSVLGRRARERPASPASPRDLPSIWRRVYAINLRLRERRQQGNTQARIDGRDGFYQLLATWRATGTAPVEEARALITRLRPPSSVQALRDRQADADALCQALLDLRQPIEDILAAMPERTDRRAADGQALPDTRADVAEALKELRAYRDYFFDAGATPLDTLARRLLTLDVVEVAAGSREHRIDVGAELVQISARLQSPWGGPSTPLGKLTGMGLAHFAAFYKRSWRANDWLFGRLDGIDRAVRIALNPDRLQRLYGERKVSLAGAPPIDASEYVRRYIEQLAILGAHPDLQPVLKKDWDRLQKEITTELAWLDQSAMVPPPVLRCCAEALTRRLHLEVLLHELPALALAIDQDEAVGGTASSRGKQMRVALAALRDAPPERQAEIAVGELKQALLGADVLKDEVGSDQFTRTVSQGVALVQVTAASEQSGLKALKILLKLTEWPIWVFYWLANRLAGGSRTSAAIQAAAFTLGSALVIASLVGEKMPAVLTSIGWALLGGSLANLLLRTWNVGVAATVLAMAVIAVLDPSAAFFVGGVLLLLMGSQVGLGAFLVAAVAAWWSAGRPSWDTWAALPCVESLQWLGGCASTPAPQLLAEATQLLRIGAPALLVIALALGLGAPRFAAWLRQALPALVSRFLRSRWIPARLRRP